MPTSRKMRRFFRVVHASDDARDMKHALRDLARHQVTVVEAGRRHEHVRSPDACVLLIARVAAVAVNDEIAAFEHDRQLVGGLEGLLDDRDLVSALKQNRSEVRPDLPAAGDDDEHLLPP